MTRTTNHSRIESVVYTLTPHDVNQAIRDYVAAHFPGDRAPEDVSESSTVELNDEAHIGWTATLTRKFSYPDKAVSNA